MSGILSYLNPFGRTKNSKIHTKWGSIEPSVDIFPLLYLIFMYGFIYILPFGRDVIGMSWFDWCRSEDGPLEWLQFFAFIGAAILASIAAWRQKTSGLSLTLFFWIFLAILCLFIAGEEISWGERITGIHIDSLRAINRQGESNIHNIKFIHHYLLDPAFEISCVFLGWLGWNLWPHINAFPSKQYSLYFLLVALFFFYFDISFASTVQQIRNDQEVFEVLMSLGLLLHAKEHAFPKSS